MVHWQITENDASIVITCFEHDKQGQFVAAVKRFGQRAARRTVAFCVIADLRGMTGYESEARRAWQESFREHRRLIKSVVFVGAQSRGIRMGAAVVGAVAGVPVRFVSDWSEIEG